MTRSILSWGGTRQMARMLLGAWLIAICNISSSSSRSVSCGGHTALACDLCPNGNGAAWCNGDCIWETTCKEANPAPPPTLDGCCNCVDAISFNVSSNCSICDDETWPNPLTVRAPSVHVSWQAPPEITASVDGASMLMYVAVDVLKDAPNTFFMTAGFAQGTN
jgi:hypothetical protein